MYSLVIWVGPSVQVDGCDKTLYDQFVLPMMKVTDYRTAVSGIRPLDIRKGGSAIPFKQAQVHCFLLSLLHQPPSLLLQMHHMVSPRASLNVVGTVAAAAADTAAVSNHPAHGW